MFGDVMRENEKRKLMLNRQANLRVGYVWAIVHRRRGATYSATGQLLTEVFVRSQDYMLGVS